MRRLAQLTTLALAIFGAANSASAFSLLGPFDVWQVARIGYNIPENGDLGGPMNRGDEYRWNMRTITFGIDSSFKTFFGQRGVEELRKAVAIINKLPPVSKMSSNLVEFPTNARGVNFQAATLG